MERFVTISSPATPIAFPDAFASRIRHDAERKRLVYQGFMSKADFDRLSQVSDDWGYRRSLEDLFRLCGPDDVKPRGLRRLASMFAIFGF